MFDIGWSEMLVVGVVALIVVGPKDLPKMFHTLGELTGKARGMAREFQRAMDAAAKESGVGDIVKDFKRTASGQGLKDAAGFGDIEKEFRDIDKTAKAAGAKPGAGTILNPTLPADPEADDEAAHLDDETEAARREAKIAAHEAELAARNAKLAATEAERLKRAEKAAAARVQAAEIRARREAAPQTPEAES